MMRAIPVGAAAGLCSSPESCLANKTEMNLMQKQFKMLCDHRSARPGSSIGCFSRLGVLASGPATFIPGEWS